MQILSKFFVKIYTVILFYNTCYIIIVYYCLLLFFIILYCFVLFFYHLFLLFIPYLIYQNQNTKPSTNQIKKTSSSTLDILVHHQPLSTWSWSTTSKGTTFNTIISQYHYIIISTHLYHINTTLSSWYNTVTLIT